MRSVIFIFISAGNLRLPAIWFIYVNRRISSRHSIYIGPIAQHFFAYLFICSKLHLSHMLLRNATKYFEADSLSFVLGGLDMLGRHV
jgi:hypothetical protein